MNKYKKPKYSKEDLGDNIFLTKLVIPVNKVKSEDKYKISDQWAGEDAIYEPANFSYDALPYSKLFIDASRRKKMVSLLPGAKDLLLWVLYELKAGDDSLWINHQMYMEENEIKSINTYKVALKDLIKKGFLAISVIKGVYWINPDFIFRGDRLKAFPDNVKVKHSN